jgi:outer membrane autotransporter protein
LLVNGSLTASPVTVANTAQLGGGGMIAGPIIVQAGGTLSPGASIGKLTVNNSVTLQAGSITRMEISATPHTNDQLHVTGLFTCAGSLIITNVAGDLSPGATFALFQTLNSAGGFSSVTLPPLNFGLTWNTNNLSAGSISVVATNAPVLTDWHWQPGGDFVVSGLGSASQIYTLHAATNLTSPIEWTPVANTVSATDGTFLLTDPQAPNHPQRFYHVTAP